MSELDNLLDDALADFESDANENVKSTSTGSSSQRLADFNDFTQVCEIRCCFVENFKILTLIPFKISSSLCHFYSLPAICV